MTNDTDTGSDNRKFGFFMIDNAVIDDLDLSPFTGWLYVVIVRHINQQTGDAFPSIPTLAKKSVMSEQSVINHLKKLTEAGLIAIEKTTREDGGQGVNHYRLVNLVSSPSQRDTPPPVNKIDPNNTNNNNTDKSENVSPEAKQARARESASDNLSKNEQPPPDDTAKVPLTGYGDDYQIKPTSTLADSQNPFQNKNESGDSVPILDDVCPDCANITHSIVDANGIKSLSCKCKPPDNPTDNPTISPTQVWILQKANDINVYVKASHFGSAPKDVEYLHSIGYLRRYKGQTASYIITSKGIQWLKDNPDATSELSRIEVVRKDTKPKKRIGKKQTPTELSPELQPIADALAQARHNRPFKELLNGNRAGIMKIATQFHADGLTSSDVETIQEYFEHMQKTNADGKLIWLTCNYNTYLKHAQDAIDWKKNAPKKASDGIRMVTHVEGLEGIAGINPDDY